MHQLVRRVALAALVLGGSVFALPEAALAGGVRVVVAAPAPRPRVVMAPVVVGPRYVVAPGPNMQWMPAHYVMDAYGRTVYVPGHWQAIAPPPPPVMAVPVGAVIIH